MIAFQFITSRIGTTPIHLLSMSFMTCADYHFFTKPFEMAEKAGDKGHHEDNSVQKKPALFPYSKLTAFQWFTDVPFLILSIT